MGFILAIRVTDGGPPERADGLVPRPVVGKATAMENFSLRTSHDGPRSIVAVAGEIDLAVADLLWAELDPHITAGRTVVLDCTDVQFIDSIGLRILIMAARKAEAVEAGFRLSQPTAVVLRLLDLAGVGEVFGIDADDDLPV